MEEQSPLFQVAVSISESVFIAILLLLLMVFLSVFCLRCLKSKSEDRELLLGGEESTQEDSTHPENHISYETNLSEERERTRKQVEAEIQPTSTKEVTQQSAILRQAEAQPGPAATDGTTEEWLTIKKFRDVFNAVWPARLKWYEIGIELGLQLVQLDVIERDNFRRTDVCMRAMIQAWLRQGGTWKELISALKHETVECNDVASSITAKYIEFTAKIESISNSSASSSRVTIMPRKKDFENDPLYSDSFEDLDTTNLTDVESRNLKARLRLDTRRIIRAFSDLVIHMRKSFKQRNVNPQALATTVKGIAMCERSTQSLQKKLKIQEITSIDMLVAYLLEESYISFINYFLVGYMIEHHGTEQDERMLAIYKTKFETYCKRSVFEVPKDVFGSVPSDSKELVFKVDDDSILLDSASYTPTEGAASSKNFEPSLGDAQFILEKVSEALNLEVGNLILVGVSRGCVELTFSAPKVVVDQIQTRLHVNGHVHCKLERKGVHILCGLPGKPQVTKVRDICYCLDWTKPSYQGFHPIRHYKISYRSVQDRPKVWKTFETESPTESIALSDEIIHPQHESSFVFKVQAVTDIGCGLYSEESDPVFLPSLSTTDTPIHQTLFRSFSERCAVQKNDSLTSDDFQEVMNTLNPFREKWYDIGKKLGVNEMTLDELQRKYKISNTCLRKMLLAWLTQRDASREALSSVLNDLRLYDASDSISGRSPYASAINRSRSYTLQ